MMRVFVLLLAASAVWGADDVQMRLALRAQADFVRVELSATPQLRDTEACAQSVAAMLPLADPGEAALLHFRKGYCRLTAALITRDKSGFAEAAGDFDRAVAAWVAQPRDRSLVAEPAPSALRALAAIARLAEGAGDPTPWGAQLSAAAAEGACPAALMPERLCREVLGLAKAWQGWIALRQSRPEDAVRSFDAVATPGWAALATARVALARRQYREAAAAQRKSVEAWRPWVTNPPLSIPRGLVPPPDFAQALAELGGAELAAGDARAALASLDEAVRRRPSAAWTIFMRARAHESLGQAVAGLADYNLASRASFAAAEDEHPAGDAHFYRGVWLYRRNETGPAEEEFANALNSGVSDTLRRDVSAWRNLAAVRNGGCTDSRQALERALPTVSPFFPQDEARSSTTACRAPAMAAGR
jgi:tetratricopeptide (TPR) repeat protein